LAFCSVFLDADSQHQRRSSDAALYQGPLSRMLVFYSHFFELFWPTFFSAVPLNFMFLILKPFAALFAPVKKGEPPVCKKEFVSFRLVQRGPHERGMTSGDPFPIPPLLCCIW